MAPNRILIIRHAEEHDVAGVTAESDRDAHSLTVKGWQRAGALVRLFYPGERGRLTPDVLFTSAVAPDSRSLRPRQTIAPLHARLREVAPVGYNEAFAKAETRPLMEAVLACQGTVLIAWEHSQIPHCVAALPNPPRVPEQWPKQRYDLIWAFDRRDGGWDFEQIPQNLLANDTGHA